VEAGSGGYTAIGFIKANRSQDNAGITGVDKSTHEVMEQTWDAVFAVDVKGVFFVTKHVIPYMKKNGGGGFVNMSSIYGLVGSHELAPYHAAKRGVTIMTKKDAVTYGRDNIHVNSIHPGTIMTPLVKELASRGPGLPSPWHPFQLSS
jgi:NAD(P)-dependent dehydrogenase (short-subunit alcohol dehydrogenase family)